MPFKYIDVEEAIAANGLRMVVVGNVPSPWGEAAKGILHVKGIDWSAVRLVYDNPALKEWAGQLSGPVAIYKDKAPRSGWAEILLMAERLAPTPSLIPEDTAERAQMFGFAHELMGEQGLCWSRRVQSVHGGLTGAGGFPKPVAEYLAGKYGYTPELGEMASQRVRDLLGLMTAHLTAQASAGQNYYFGNRLSAADIYSAVSVAMFAPLPEEVCPMNPKTRETFNTMDEATRAALDPMLIAHRDRIYAEHLELPLNL